MKPLESDFSECTSDQWWKIIEKELKGKPIEGLSQEWLEGITIPPFNAWDESRNTKAVFEEGIWRSAEICSSNKELLNSLNRGAEAFILKAKAAELKPSLTGVQLNYLFGWYDTQEPKALTEEYTKFLQQEEIKAKEAPASLGFDPIDFGFRHSDFDGSSFLKGLSDSKWDVWAHRHFVDLRKYQSAGAPADLQLAIALSAAYEHFYHHPAADPNHFHFAFAQGRDFILETTKLRSFRTLWKNLLSELSISTLPNKTFVSAENSYRYLSGTDPHGNLLRLTTNALSSVLGGADLVTLHSHTIDYTIEQEVHLPINILHLIRFEAGLSTKLDRTAGSFTIENLSKAISTKAWELFKEMEKEGGLIKAVHSGWINSKIKAADSKEQEAFDKGELPIIGSDLFPYSLESKKTKTPISSNDFPIRRLAEKIEQKSTSK